MKRLLNFNLLVTSLLILTQGCMPQPPAPEWLGLETDLSRIKSQILTYKMYDSSGTKIGRMVLRIEKEADKIIVRDTSKLDDNSVYETAFLEIDLEEMRLKRMKINLDINSISTSLSADLTQVGQRLMGNYTIGDKKSGQVTKIDSAYKYDVFREELISTLGIVEINKHDTLTFDMFLWTSLSHVESSIYYEKQDKIKVPAGEFEVTQLYLNTQGFIDNRIWITSKPPHYIVKFEVPKQHMTIELARVLNLRNKRKWTEQKSINTE